MTGFEGKGKVQGKEIYNVLFTSVLLLCSPSDPLNTVYQTAYFSPVLISGWI